MGQYQFKIEYLYKQSGIAEVEEKVIKTNTNLFEDFAAVKRLEDSLTKAKDYQSVKIFNIEEISEKQVAKHQSELKNLKQKEKYYKERLTEVKNRIEIKENVLMELEGFEVEYRQ